MSISVLGSMLAGCNDDKVEAASVEREAQIKVAASQVSYDPGTTGLPTDVQDAITAVFQRELIPGPAGPQGPEGPQGPAGESLTSYDQIDGLPCNGSLGVIRLRYVDSSEVGDGPFSISLKCLATHPVLSFNPTYHDFQYTIDSPTFVQLTNRGGVPVTLGGLACEGDCGRFAIGVNTCDGAVLDADASCFFAVSFSPGSLPCGFFEFDATYRATTDVPVGGSNILQVAGTYLCIP